MEKRTAGIIPFIHEPCHPKTQRSLHKFSGILLVKVERCSGATFKKKGAKTCQERRENFDQLQK
jgi:hypothetical protein